MTDLAAEPLARQYVRGQPTPLDNPNDTLMRDYYAKAVAERQQPAKLTAAAPPVQRLAVSDEDVRRAYYESAGYTMWITSMQLDPLQLMVCDDASGKYFRVPISLSGDKFDFGDPVEVAIEYKDVSTPAGAKAAASTVVWTSRAASVALDNPPAETEPVTEPVGPAPVVPAPTLPRVDPAAGAAIRGMAGAPVKPPVPATPPAGEPAPTTERLSTVDGIKMREALGLATDASDEELRAAIAAALPTEEPAGGEAVPDAASLAAVAAAASASQGERILVDRTQIAALQASARKGEQAWAQLRTNERDTVLKQAMSDGKFPPARRDHYQRLWDADPEGTRNLVAALAPNLIPTSLSGHMGSDEALTEAALAYDALYPKAV